MSAYKDMKGIFLLQTSTYEMSSFVTVYRSSNLIQIS